MQIKYIQQKDRQICKNKYMKKIWEKKIIVILCYRNKTQQGHH